MFFSLKINKNNLKKEKEKEMLSLLLLSLTTWEGVVGSENVIIIHNAKELTDFANNISYEKTYQGTTVLLGSDIVFTEELSQEFEPIGYSENSNFRGTFDGQGYAISNLAMNSSRKYTGLFTCTDTDTIIRNIILDDSCTITNSYIKDPYYEDYCYVGGIVGRSYSKKIENCVNMASVTFNGSASNSYMGGIIGEAYSYEDKDHEYYIRNCVNYGLITYSGESESSYIGGIAGRSLPSIYNCINYGGIVYNGISVSNKHIGGIFGSGSANRINNCVNFGSITYSGSNEGTYIGAIAGYIGSSSSLSNCYWNENIQFDFCGDKNTYDNPPKFSSIAKFNDNFVLNETVSASKYTGTSLIEALNAAVDYYTLRDYSHWTLNKEEKEMSFTLNNEKRSYTYNSKIILLPNLANSGRTWFNGWYTNIWCTMPFTKNEIDVATELYGKFEENYKTYTISLDTRGGDPLDPITAKFSSVVELPTPTRNDCQIIHWETEYGDKVENNFTMPAKNVTLYPFWFCTHLISTKEFIDFANFVNSGTNFRGTTVFLETDVDLSGVEFEPIGTWSNTKIIDFLGTFDGQGHIISNLKINVSTGYAGLFGYSDGMTVRNLVLDESCSISCYSHYQPSIGGLIGSCSGEKETCIIENCVNKASVSYTGNNSKAGYFTHIGGIVGGMNWYNNQESHLTNCSNYGAVTYTGECFNANIGGIAGMASRTYIHDCTNYGNVTFSGTTSSEGELSIKGIVGYQYECSVNNCKNKGKVKVSGASTLSLGLAWVLLVLLLL